jgi:hypothetical protein
MANQQITQMDLDFTGVESFSLIPLGVHTVKVKDAEFTKAQTGSSQLAIDFEDANGATRKMWCSLVPQALWKAKQVLEALGLTGLDGRVRLNTKTLIGRTCQITVENDPNDDSRQIVSRVSKVASAPIMETPVSANPLPAAPVPPQAAASMTPPTAPTVMETPSMTPSSPSEPVQAPTAQPNPAPQGNLPPWMQNAQAQGATTPQGNLPPWMRPQQ